ncbi:MAG: helix-turn-helix domain-containing protein [Actinomycetota bacterium]
MDRHDPLRRIVTAVEVGRATEGAEGALIVPDAEVDVLWCPGTTPFLAGPDTGPSTSIIGRGAPYVRVQIRRGRAAAITGAGVHETTDRRIELVDIWSDPRWARLRDEEDTAAGLPVLLDALRDRIHDRWEPDRSVELALSGLDPGIGERQLRRRFHWSIGYGPATLRRIERFNAVRRLCDRPDQDLAAAAATVGYSDQAHLSREVKRLTGLTPSAYFA